MMMIIAKYEICSMPCRRYDILGWDMNAQCEKLANEVS